MSHIFSVRVPTLRLNLVLLARLPILRLNKPSHMPNTAFGHFTSILPPPTSFSYVHDKEAFCQHAVKGGGLDEGGAHFPILPC